MKIFFSRLLSRKITIPKSKVTIPCIVVVFVIFCCLPFSVVLVDSSLRTVGLLPTYTPKPTKNPTVTATETPIPSETITPLPSTTPEPSSTPKPSNTAQPTDTQLPTNTQSATATPIEGSYVELIEAFQKMHF